MVLRGLKTLGVADVARVLLKQVEEDPLERRGVGSVPALTRLAQVIEAVGFDDGPGPRGLLV